MTKKMEFLSCKCFCLIASYPAGTPLLETYRCINLIAISAVVFVTTFAVGNFNHLSIATKIYASLFSSSGRGPAKSNCISSFGSTTGST